MRHVSCNQLESDLRARKDHMIHITLTPTILHEIDTVRAHGTWLDVRRLAAWPGQEWWYGRITLNLTPRYLHATIYP